jgi:hypothetical protein
MSRRLNFTVATSVLAAAILLASCGGGGDGGGSVGTQMSGRVHARGRYMPPSFSPQGRFQEP